MRFTTLIYVLNPLIILVSISSIVFSYELCERTRFTHRRTPFVVLASLIMIPFFVSTFIFSEDLLRNIVFVIFLSTVVPLTIALMGIKIALREIDWNNYQYIVSISWSSSLLLFTIISLILGFSDVSYTASTSIYLIFSSVLIGFLSLLIMYVFDKNKSYYVSLFRRE